MFPFAFSFVLLLLFYFGLPLPITDTLFIPQIALLPLAGMMLARRPDFKVVLVVALGSAFLVGWVIMLSGGESIDATRRFLSGIQLVYNLGLCAIVATAQPLDEVTAHKVSRWCLAIGLFMALVGILEIFTPLREVSDAFREFIYRDSAYSADLRDLGLAGFIRPKAFASEPAHAAWGICMMVLCAVAFRPARATFVYGILILGVTTLIFVSPNTPLTVLFLSMIAMILFWDRRRIASTLLTAGLISIVGAAVALFFLSNMWSGRYAAYSGYEGSFYIRVIQPVSLAENALRHNWLVGVGFGGLESIWTQITSIDGGASAENLNRTPGMALLTIPLFAGVSGVVFFFAIIAGLFWKLGGRYGTVAACVLVFTLLQKQSFVISTAWAATALWMLQTRVSVDRARQTAARNGPQAPQPLPARARLRS
jgi:hypothetical protein